MHPLQSCYRSLRCDNQTTLFLSRLHDDLGLVLACVLDGVLAPVPVGVVVLPARCREDVCVALEPRAQADLARVRLVLLNSRIRFQAGKGKDKGKG